ncbi:iron-containing alcohol dehydrogenase [Actinobaculum suis]|uniref:Iron-containing alcohol dehydrogenase n=1 Tax=Actinobaculum suis TaxID=1657 RepID=A0A1B9BC67_9ACTO|nr:lactaldehyde reductase [Actinobaculum suis]OCA93267.1 lactaldehyde reductase [Actinobaculum suis]OCA94421.1 lactaldehyde reductase [Actinobaculum suis]VDG76686.1 iron-containing alcohol dehydrogenase [Actinobaculum suis]
MTYRMILNQTAYFGRGALDNLVPELERRGFQKALVVTDKGVEEAGILAQLTMKLEAANFAYAVFADVVPNPPVENVQAGVEALHAAQADVIIGIGGGSPQDTAKAIGIIGANPEFSDVVSLEGTAATKNPAIPIIGIPTTAGTASEVTINYVITDTAKQRKFVCVDPHDIPVMAIVDPDLMDGMPRSLKVATGLDALTHAIEGFVTPGAWELSDAVHEKAFRMIAKNLQPAADGDSQALEKMAYASYIAGMGYSNVGLGLVHGMAHPLGGRYDAPHGVANGILLAPVMAYNQEYTGEKYRDIADAFGVADAYSRPLETVREEAVSAVANLTKALGNPTKISEVGVTEAGLDDLAADAYADVCTPGNPRPATLEDIRAIYASLL